jgi:peroxiredoxin
MFLASGSFADELQIGNKAPGWSKLSGTDGKKHSLADYKDAKAIVTVFTCNHCPVAIAYENRLIALQKDYQDKAVQVVAINSNCEKVSPGDSFEKMEVRAAGKDRKRGSGNEDPFNFPYLHDSTQQVARDYGATCTPHVFVLCPQRRIAYMGAVDDNMNAEKVEEQYLRDALDAVLAGKQPPKTKTQQRGCSIKWKKDE